MGAATYVGRVGGLAVALGVGTAIALGPGTAGAETTDSTTSADTNSEQSSTGPTGAAGSTPTQTDADTQESTATEVDDADEATEADKSEAATTTTDTVGPGVTVSAQTNTGTSAPAATATPGSAEPDAEHDAEPDVEPDAEPTDTTEPEPASTPPTAPPTAPPSTPTDSGDTDTDPAQGGDSRLATTKTPAAATGSSSTEQDPATAVTEPQRVAVFVDARSLASAGPQTYSPMKAAATTPTVVAPLASPAPPDLFTAAMTTVANVVSSAINWILNPLAGTAPASPAQPPLIWGLLAFARREFENLFSAWAGRPATPEPMLAAQTTTSLAFARAAAVAIPPGPFPNAQVSPSTQFVSWVTGANRYPNPLLANTVDRYSVWGTDVGIMWDNGIPDDPTTPINEHQVLIAVGDTFGGPRMTGDWRSNTIFRSSDVFLADGMEIPDGQWYTGNMFGGAPLGPDGFPTRARQVIFPEGLPAGVTLIPTAGISVPTPGTRFGATQYVSFMSVTQWGAPGSWTTNYSAIAYSEDNGETFRVAPQSVRYNQPWTGNQNFQQSAFVRPGDGYVYVYGTPNGRQGAAYVSRVPERDILNLTKYEYWSAGQAGGWFGWGATPAGWNKNNPAAATAVFGADAGACGVANPGNQVSEMSVQYNKSLKKYVALHGDQFNNIVMRTSDTPQGTWSSAKVLMPQQSAGIYAPMMHPWSPSTQGTGSELYWNLSVWSDYNVVLMRTDLTKV